MKVIAITGGLGAGKSEAARYLGDRGAVVLELDQIAKDLLDNDPAVRESIIASFGRGILADDGSVSRSALAAEAFRTPENARMLSAVVHPDVVLIVRAKLTELAYSGEPPAAVVLEVPMLVETPSLRELADLVVTIESPEALRLARAVERGMTADDAMNRMKYQADDAARRKIAHVVLENLGTTAELHATLDAFWNDHVATTAGGRGGSR